jgi:hypothetical protein
MTPDTLPKASADLVRGLSDHSLDVLYRAAGAEIRRRKRIRKHNAEWTAGTGLVDCLQASLKKESP